MVTWSITRLVVESTKNLVTKVEWACNGPTERAYGAIPVEEDNSKPFIPYADLTEAKVLEWIKPRLDVVEIEKALSKTAQSDATPPLPWVN